MESKEWISSSAGCVAPVGVGVGVGVGVCVCDGWVGHTADRLGGI